MSHGRGCDVGREVVSYFTVMAAEGVRQTSIIHTDRSRFSKWEV
jgi:hypothetical protein